MRRKNDVSISDLIPAAQYLRMSTDDQQYSIAFQIETIAQFAAEHNYAVVASYADEGRSGVGLKTRDGLRRLLRDVLSGNAPFKTILVYDVSRWGRFQDLDEAAYYEFLCKSNGIPIRYCAEQFSNDGSMPSSIMKALKRTMAAEYSRELGVKVFAGQTRLAKMGFRVCGTAGLGLRRMMMSPDSPRKLILQYGEHKAIKTHHTILVPGPKKEIDVVRKIFALALHKQNTPRRIARELNRQKLWPWLEDRRWDEATVRAIITNEKYMGCNVYGKTAKKLGAPSRRTQKDQWVIAPDAFVPIVEPETFARIQKLIRSRNKQVSKPNEYYLKGLRRILARHGKITERLSTGRGICSHGMYAKRFGSILRAYELVGYKPSAHAFKSLANQEKVRNLRTNLLSQLKQTYPENLRLVHLPGQRFREVLEFDRHVRIAVHICGQVRGSVSGEPRWLLKAQPLEDGYPCLICLPDRGLKAILSYHLVPQFAGIIKKYKTLKESHKWLAAGHKLRDLSQLHVLAIAMAGEWQEKDGITVIGDVVISSRTSTVTLGRKDFVLAPIHAELFKVLVRNAGNVVSRRQLFHPFAGSQFPSAQLNAHMCELRRKLGPRLRERIQTVKNEGYKYVMPSASGGIQSTTFTDRILSNRLPRL
jgi:DNA-binding winged helix-turn-helix (wHTH) protein